MQAQHTHTNTENTTPLTDGRPSNENAACSGKMHESHVHNSHMSMIDSDVKRLNHKIFIRLMPFALMRISSQCMRILHACLGVCVLRREHANVHRSSMMFADLARACRVAWQRRPSASYALDRSFLRRGRIHRFILYTVHVYKF